MYIIHIHIDIYIYMFVCLYVYIEWLCQAWPFRGHRLQNFGKNRAEAPRPRPPCQRFPWVFEGRHGWAPPAAWPRRLKPAAQPWLGSWWNESMTRNIWRHQILKKKHALHIECKRLTWSILLKHTLDIQQRIGGYCGEPPIAGPSVEGQHLCHFGSCPEANYQRNPGRNFELSRRFLRGMMVILEKFGEWRMPQVIPSPLEVTWSVD